MILRGLTEPRADLAMRARERSKRPLDEEARALDAREIHVWHVSAGEMRSNLDHFACWLSPEESLRAGRFRFQKHRVMYVIAHGTLRDILARYLGERPDCVELGRTKQGKPLLGGRQTGSTLGFNISHSGDILMVAIASGRRIGVDVEELRAGFEWESVARFALPSEAVEELARQPVDLGLELFFGAWTAVEALAKATGRGLSDPALSSEQRVPWPIVPRPMKPAVGRWGTSAWWLYSLTLPRGHAGSVVVEAVPEQPSGGAPMAPRLVTREYTFAAWPAP